MIGRAETSSSAYGLGQPRGRPCEKSLEETPLPMNGILLCPRSIYQPPANRVAAMARVPELEDILNEKFDLPSVKAKTLVSRSGMHIAGKVPSTAHLETYVAMSAIIHGAADPIASELGDKLRYINIEMEGSKLMLVGLAGKA